MRVLVACEESQAVCIEFRKRGHEAYSCDILPASGGHPEWHIKGDVLEILNDGWDMMIAHPPCTYLCVSGIRWLTNPDGSRNFGRLQKRNAALFFVRQLMDAPIEKIAIENPVSVISSKIRKPEQIIKPCYFGDDSTKKTCLWLKNLPPLHKTNEIETSKVTTKSGKVWDKWFFDTSCISNRKERSRVRSITFPGIAKAIANQWG